MKSPVKSIRAYCLWCCNGSVKEVKLCPIHTCPLFLFRFGKKMDDKLTPVKAIRLNCLDCSTYSPKEVKNCQHFDCDLYHFRQGKNPNRKGIGGNTNLTKGKNINSAQEKILSSTNE